MSFLRVLVLSRVRRFLNVLASFCFQSYSICMFSYNLLSDLNWISGEKETNEKDGEKRKMGEN